MVGEIGQKICTFGVFLSITYSGPASTQRVLISTLNARRRKVGVLHASTLLYYQTLIPNSQPSPQSILQRTVAEARSYYLIHKEEAMPLISGAQRNRGRARASSSSHSTPNPQRRRPVELPEYEPLSCPMDNASRSALSALSTNNADMRKYEEQLKTSIQMLTDSVRDINDRQRERKEELKGKRGGRSQTEDEEDEDEIRNELERINEDAFLRLRDTVPPLTAECEKAVRDVIDLRVEIEDGRKALQDTLRKVEFESANAANRSREADAGEGGDHAMEDAHPDVMGPLRILKNEKEKAAADYATRSLEERYAVDNDYIGFKRLWWDAIHGLAAKPLPDASRWFKDSKDEEEEEEDLVIAEEHVSIYCPLSMVVMDEPCTSKVCNHTFNKPAIVQFLRSQPNRTAKCPQTGCSKVCIPIYSHINLMRLSCTPLSLRPYLYMRISSC